MKRNASPQIGIGMVSLTVIFVTLCLAVFALLSLSTAQADRRLSQTTAQAVADYYAVDLICAEKTDQMEAALKSGASIQKLRQLAAGLSMEAVPSGAGTQFSFQQKIDKNRALSVAFSIQNGKLRITKWQVISTGDWTPKDHIPVWTES